MDCWKRLVEKYNKSDEADEELEPEMREMLFQRWFDVSLDLDRQLLTITTAALGLLMTVVASKGLETKVQLFSFLGAVFLFFLTICALLLVNNLNKKVLGSMLNHNRQVTNPLLTIAESFSHGLFIAGVLCTGAFFVAMALHTHEKNIGAVNDGKEESARSNNGWSNLDAQSVLKGKCPDGDSTGGLQGDDKKCSARDNGNAKSKAEPSASPANKAESK